MGAVLNVVPAKEDLNVFGFYPVNRNKDFEGGVPSSSNFRSGIVPICAALVDR